MTYSLEDLASMSDEDFKQAGEAAEQAGTSLYDDVEEAPVEQEEQSAQPVAETVTEESKEEQPELEQEQPELEESENTDEPELESEGETETEQLEEQEEESEAVDFEKQMAELFEPFPANGTTIKVDTVQEAKELMKMGANYHKKMHMLKPHLKMIRTLESKNLLDENSLNLLIEVASGNKDAISSLLAKNNISLDDLDEAKGSEGYSPEDHTISDSNYNLRDTLDELKDMPMYQDTMDAISGWDESSKGVLMADPVRLKTLRAHKENGTFDLINDKVKKLQALGQLDNISDVDAYQKAAEQIYIESRQQKVAPNVAKPAPSKPVAQKTVVDKSKFSAPKQTPTQSRVKDLDNMTIEQMAKLSDEDFGKLSSKYF